MELMIEANSRAVAYADRKIGETVIAVTPAIGGDYWLLRVPVSDDQAVVAFPKFGTVGIGFQSEEDWNRNLPHSAATEEIFAHIACNKGDPAIPDARCIEAIRLLKARIRELTTSDQEA